MKPKKSLARNIIFLIIIAIFVWYIFSHHNEFNKFVDALSQGSWRWLFVALLTQLGFFSMIALTTQATFKAVHLERKFLDLAPLVFGSLFLNVLAPTGGQTGTILYADDAARRKESSPKAVIANILATVISYIALSVILIFSIFYLKSFNLLNNYEVIGVVIFAFPIVVPAFLVFSSVKYPDFTLKTLSWIQNMVNKIVKIFKKPAKLEPGWAKTVSTELAEAVSLAINNLKRLALAFSYALAAHAINIISLVVIFESFEIKIYYGAVIAGYAFGELVRIISPQPEGVGIVEVVMAVIFSSFGVPVITATAIAIVFRGLNFWIPLGIGFFLLKRLPSFRS